MEARPAPAEGVPLSYSLNFIPPRPNGHFTCGHDAISAAHTPVSQSSSWFARGCTPPIVVVKTCEAIFFKGKLMRLTRLARVEG